MVDEKTVDSVSKINSKAVPFRFFFAVSIDFRLYLFGQASILEQSRLDSPQIVCMMFGQEDLTLKVHGNLQGFKAQPKTSFGETL